MPLIQHTSGYDDLDPTILCCVLDQEYAHVEMGVRWREVVVQRLRGARDEG